MRFACDYECCEFEDRGDCECGDCFLCGGTPPSGEKLEIGMDDLK